MGRCVGVADTPEEVLERVAQSTGIPVDDLHYHATGPERGIDMGRNLLTSCSFSSSPRATK